MWSRLNLPLDDLDPVAARSEGWACPTCGQTFTSGGFGVMGVHADGTGRRQFSVSNTLQGASVRYAAHRLQAVWWYVSVMSAAEVDIVSWG